MGHELSNEQLASVLDRIKNCTETKHGISPSRLETMVNEAKQR
jgi:methanogen homocitrate synthase